MIVVWTKRSVGAEGHFVRDEARRAQRRGAYLPVCLDLVEPPLGFGEIQALPLIRWKGDRSDPRFQALACTVRDCLAGRRAAAPQRRGSEPGLSRRALIGSVAGAAVIAAAGGGWALLRPGSAATSNRIAVLPFVNLSGDPAQDYFSEGVAEELRGALTRIGMQVIGRASSNAVKDMDTQAAAAKLGVANILTGSVRRSAGTIRIGAQLVNGRDGVEKWSANYDRAPGDTIKIQTDIAAQVAGALRITLGVAKQVALTLGGTADAAAQDLYLQVLSLSKQTDGQEALRKMIGLPDAALARDPDYGDAHLLKASLLDTLAAIYSTSPAELADGLKRAEQSARRAAALMPGSARVTAELADISLDSLDYPAALRGSQMAVALLPNDSWVLKKALDSMSWLVDGPSALNLADRAIALDPLSPGAYGARGDCLFSLRRYPEAIDAYNKTLLLAPQRNGDRWSLAQCLILLDRTKEASAVLAKLPGGSPLGRAMIAARAHDRATVEAIIAKVRDAAGDTASYQYGQIYAQLGDVERAIAALQKAVEVRDPGLLALKRDPLLDPVRRDPRYAALLVLLRFP